MQSATCDNAKRIAEEEDDIPAAATGARHAARGDDNAGPPGTAADYVASVFWGPAGLEQIVADRARITATLDAQRFDNFVDWHAAYLEAVAAQPERLCFCVVSRTGRAAALVALELASRPIWGLMVAGWELPNEFRMPTGDCFVTDGSDPAVYAPALLAALSQAAGRRWHYLRLANVRGPSPLAAALTGQGGGGLVVRVNGCGWCSVVPDQERLAAMSKSFSRKVRKDRKRLSATEGAAFVTVSAGAELDGAYEEFLRVEAANWKGAEGSRTALAFDATLREFYRHLMRRLARRGRAEIHLLRLGERAIAGQYSITTDDTIYLVKIGYDQDYSHLSPGVVLLDRLFGYAGEKPGITGINFTTDMPWMKDWRTSCEEVFDHFLFRRTLRGQLARLYWGLAEGVLHHRRTWIGPLYRRLVGTRARRYRLKREKESRDER